MDFSIFIEVKNGERLEVMRLLPVPSPGCPLYKSFSTGLFRGTSGLEGVKKLTTARGYFCNYNTAKLKA
jgi:hypothetical protein